MIAREEVINKSQDPTTIMAKLQELELAPARPPKAKNKSAPCPKKFPVRC